MAETKREFTKGQRIAIALFSILLYLLVVWLLGFVTEDIGSVQGPNLDAVKTRHLDPTMLAKRASLQHELSDVVRLQKDERDKQSLLRDSTGSSKETMNQLLEMQKMGLEKGVRPSADEQKALAESEQLFLANQRKYQECNEKITALSEKQRKLEEDVADLDKNLQVQNRAAETELQGLQKSHNIVLAALKLLVLVPLLFAALFAVLKWRHSLYAPFAYTFGAAVLTEVIMVMHEHFPTKYFKYILILAALVLVVRIMVFILKAATAPRPQGWQDKARREAYQRSVCPNCAFPVKTGALRAMVGVGQGNAPGSQQSPEKAEYTCPSCGTKVYEPCTACGGLRHSLLPYCERCGAKKDAGGESTA